MKELSRTQNSARNLVVGTVMYVLTQVVSFISRTIFIKLLGDQYLGISGLYSNILQLLALADLGVTTAFTFALYKPLADKDYNKIATLLGFFKKLFIIIAGVVFLVGICFVPFLKYIIKDSLLEYEKLQLYFILSVINTACSYLAVYKSAVFRADQKVYVINEVSALTNLILHVLQIALLYITQNYVFYLLSAIFVTILNNVILTILSNRAYPQIFKEKPSSLPKEEKKRVFANLKSLILYRICAAIMNSTSNIIISVLLGTVIVGYYSNYAMIITMITAIISILCNALLASIGNLGTSKQMEKSGQLFHSILFIFYAVGAFCSACFICVFNDFIYTWLEDTSYLLSQQDVYLIVFAFFITCISNPIWMFRESFGLFSQAKYVMAFAAGINLILSILGGIFLGVGGIIAAGGIARVLTMFWYEPKYLYRDVFNLPYKKYWLHTAYYLFQSIIIVGISVIINNILPSTLFFICLKVLICGMNTLIVILLFNYRNKYFLMVINRVKSIIKK
ncbi:MAG: hypothetical protein IKA85_02535 [Clostridia bacterium]|nr:hypothetical protein [Clostridia bacterium]